jgi:Carboxypeptidase regulatory-like domain
MRFCTDCTLRCLAALLLFCSHSGAQETKKSATITIVVKDADRSVVVGAQAKFVSRTIGETKTLVTDAAGMGALELEPASYEVIVTARGFRPLKSQIILNAGEERKIDLVLEVAGSGCPSKDCIVDFAEPMVEQEHVETKSIDIKSVQLFAAQSIVSKEKPIAFKEFRESRNGRLRPATKFDVACEIRGELDLSTENFFLWTTVDFLVAPVTEAYEKMDIDQAGSSVSWGQVTEMHDLKGVPIYSLRAGDTRRVVIKDFDLEKALASFPVGNAGNLWPWLLRINVHVQDRAGKQIVSAAHIVRLWPDSIRLPKSQ